MQLNSPADPQPDADLGPLQDNGDNGGNMLTHRPNPTSGVIDQGSDCAGLTDQRGAARGFDYAGVSGVGDNCDIGAVETREVVTFGTCSGSPLSTGAHNHTFANGTYLFFTIDSNTTLTCIEIEEMGSVHPQGHSESGSTLGTTDNWYRIEGDTDTGFTYSLAMPAAGANADTRICRWDAGLGGYNWDCGTAGDHNVPSTDRIERTGLTGFSEWAVGQDVNPTSITLNQTSAESDSLATQLITMGIGLAFALLLVFTTAWFMLRKRSGRQTG